MNDQNIHLLTGEIQYNTFKDQLECISHFQNNPSITTTIPFESRNNSLPGDLVEIFFNPVKQWIFENGEKVESQSFNEIKNYFPKELWKYVMHNYTNVFSTLEMIWLINGRIQCENMIIPTGDVFDIVKKKQFINVKGFVNDGKFFPNDKGLMPMKSTIANVDGDVIGMIDRRGCENIFKFQRELKITKYECDQKAKQLKQQVMKKLQKAKPVDKSHLFTITIDDEMCRMRDDAISFRIHENNDYAGCVDICVHCANYVTKLEPESPEFLNLLQMKDVPSSYKT